MEEEYKITITIQNTQPVELMDLSKSFQSIADEYKRFMHGDGTVSGDGELKLYVKEIRSGSIVTDLVALAPVLLPYAEHAKTIIEYAKHLKTAYDYYAGRGKEKPVLDKPSYTNLINIVEPVAKDNGSQIIFAPVINGDVNLNFSLTSTEANAIQNQVKREYNSLSVPESQHLERVLLHWHQAKNDPTSSTGDKGIIEKVSGQPKKIDFVSDGIKTEMLLSSENPFRHAYIVDANVLTVNQRPAVYQITKVHSRVPLEEGLFDSPTSPVDATSSEN